MPKPLTPLNLPFCSFPSNEVKNEHGVQAFPNELPLIDFERSMPYRSGRYLPILFSQLTNEEISEAAFIIGKSFVENEPMTKHMNPPTELPEDCVGIHYEDDFGKHTFGSLKMENIFYWFLRIHVLSKSSSANQRIELDPDLVKQSLVFKNEKNRVIGVVLNLTVDPEAATKPVHIHPFARFVLGVQKPVLDVIYKQESEAIRALSKQYPDFESAYESRKVGNLMMIAKSEHLAKEFAFDLFSDSIFDFAENGFKYVIVSATNQWTGAACEVLNGVRVHFEPFRNVKRLIKSENAKPYDVHSVDGYLSAKDSGIMIYVLKLNQN